MTIIAIIIMAIFMVMKVIAMGVTMATVIRT